jgi:N-carbamoylputrescine amidase
MIARRRKPGMPAVAAVSAPFGRDLKDCFGRIERIVKRCRERGAELVVFPEAALGGYLYEPRVPSPRLRIAPPPELRRDGPEIERLAEIAGPTVLCVGYTEVGGHSSAVCVSGDGVLGRHRKVHLPPSERFAFEPGQGFAAFDTPLGRMGMLICYDKVFPESARQLSLDGAGIVASLAAWPVSRVGRAAWARRDRQVRHFNLLDQARALENQVVWVSANQSGAFGRLRFPGQAKVVDPDGRVLASTGARAGEAVARIDVAGALRAARGELSHLGDRRPPAYGLPATRVAI